MVSQPARPERGPNPPGPEGPAARSLRSPEQPADSGIPPYENNLRDRLWMWGHDSGVYDGPGGVYNIPLSAPISMVDGIRSMGIPNVCAIRGGTPDAEYRTQFAGVKRVAWALSMGSHDSYVELKDYVFGLRETMPNLTGYYLDDFFHGTAAPESEQAAPAGPAPASLSLEQMRQLYAETVAYRRRLDLAIVLYTRQLSASIQPVMPYVDVVSLWIWDGNDIQQIAANFARYRALVPDKRTLLGIYMWDFGGKQALSVEFMARQLDHGLGLFREGQIEGLIFHCTPLCNKGLAAVDYARAWIAEHGDEGR
jgi:hypothetical protein